MRRGRALRYPDRSAPRLGLRFAVGTGHLCQIKFWLMQPMPTYRRLSRYDETGLIWLLQGRPVVALTDATAAIQNTSNSITVYRKHDKPALGPLGDSLDDF